MGIFSSIFGNAGQPEDDKDLPWNQLTSEDQLKKLLEASEIRPQLIFKHSTRCGISAMVLNRFTSQFNSSGLNADLHFLDLILYRSLSNHIASTLKIHHQSPQLIIIKNGVVVVHDSHSAINSIDLTRYN